MISSALSSAQPSTAMGGRRAAPARTSSQMTLPSSMRRGRRPAGPARRTRWRSSLGPDAQKNAEHDLGAYYEWLGEDLKQMIVGSAAKDADTVQQYISAFESHGCDELIFFPASANTEQVSLLADAAGLGAGALSSS